MVLFFQLIEEENLKGVVSMNETYELKLFSNDADVSKLFNKLLYKPSHGHIFYWYPIVNVII